MYGLKHHEDSTVVGTSKVESGRVKQIEKYAGRLAFSKFVNKLAKGDPDTVRMCCGEQLVEGPDLHRHINRCHREDIRRTAEVILLEGCDDAKWAVLHPPTPSGDTQSVKQNEELPLQFSKLDVYPWLPSVTQTEVDRDGPGRILLFYKYTELKNTEHVRLWQEVLCQRLCLTGKVRVAQEGLNGTVGGSERATSIYMEAVMKHPYFRDMTPEYFKTSRGGAEHFAVGLRVGVYSEAVPMGIDPHLVSYKDAGKHLSPEEFHEAVTSILETDSRDHAILIDCRNFYESKIGIFKGAIAPDIRKFSYWPEYVDQNARLFQGKNVYMYCTGGIRCERGSAYLKKKGICKEVYQLDGGIHKYIEQYPDGHFRGKLFVFDERYSIKANDEVLSVCVYCTKPWDNYEPCSSDHCRQLVIACPACRQSGNTACCATCRYNQQHERPLEECDCTKLRDRPAVRTNTIPSDFQQSEKQLEIVQSEQDVSPFLK